MISDQTKKRIKKLYALAQRGVEGEKETAKRKLKKLLEENDIHSLEELEADRVEYFLFSYHGKHEIRLLQQCVYKVLGAQADRTAYRSHGFRQKLGYYCTRAQKLEIELDFEFYRKVFYKELEIFMDAFIQKQEIFPPDAPEEQLEELSERDMKMALMTKGIEKHTRTVLIEAKEVK